MSDNLFHKILDKIKKESLFKKGDRVILGCSGGPDSLALLDILARVKSLFNLNITVTYFNHRLRLKESKREKEFVKRLSKSYGLDFTSGQGNVKAFAKKNKLSLQEAGRSLRYNFFFGLGKKLNAPKILLGHHRDDIVETVLLGFLKGSGLKGLSAMEACKRRDNFLIIRPMVDVSKEEIIFYLSERRLKPCLDSSNLKDTYLRNRLRLKILPILRKDINPKVDEAILRLCEIYSRENEYLDEVVSKDIKKVIKKRNGKLYIHRKNFLKCPIAIRRRILREVFSCYGIIGEGSNFQQIEILRNFISIFQPGKALDLAGGLMARGGYGGVSIEKKKTVSKKGGLKTKKIDIPGETVIDGLGIKIRATLHRVGSGRKSARPSLRDMKKASPQKVFLDRDMVKLPLYVRGRRPGDSFSPLGMRGTIKLKKYFINAKIPRERRSSIPLVVSGREIIWIVGYAISEKAKLTHSTKDILTLHQI